MRPRSSGPTKTWALGRSKRNRENVEVGVGRLIVGVLLLALQMILVFGDLVSGFSLAFAQFGLATVLQVYVGWPYFVGALHRARDSCSQHGHAHRVGHGSGLRERDRSSRTIADGGANWPDT